MNELNLGESVFVGGYPSILDLPHAAEIVSRFTGAIQRVRLETFHFIGLFCYP